MCIFWMLFILGIVSIEASDREAEIQKLVIHGVDVDIKQYPYTAQVILEQSSACGGAVISKRVVATAGHCVYSDGKLMAAADTVVYLGSSSSMGGKAYDACEVMKHPKYGKAKEDYFFDIGLILLSKTINLNSRVQIAKIAPSKKWKTPKSTLTIAGFGATDNSDTLPSRLSATRMRYVPPKTCTISQTADDDPMPVPNHMFCMVGNTWTSDCRGDSGSAIVWKTYIVGLVSLGRDARDGSCGSENIPSMYTDLTFFRNWVYHNVKELEAISTSQCKDVSQLGKLKKKRRKRKNKQRLTSFIDDDEFAEMIDDDEEDCDDWINNDEE